jgi:hypothetical protein
MTQHLLNADSNNVHNLEVGKMSILSTHVVHMTPLAAVGCDCQNSTQTRIDKSTEEQVQ